MGSQGIRAATAITFCPWRGWLCRVPMQQRLRAPLHPVQHEVHCSLSVVHVQDPREEGRGWVGSAELPCPPAPPDCANSRQGISYLGT